MLQEKASAPLETLGSMLERLNSVVSDTIDCVGHAEKIHSITSEATHRLGFAFPRPIGADASNGSQGPVDGPPAPITALQRLDSLISMLDNTNAKLRRINEDNDQVRSVLEGQL